MEKNNTVPVFFTIDDSYAPFAGVAIASAVKNSSADHNYKAIVINNGLSEENKKKLKALEKNNFSVEFVPMKSCLESITDKMGNRLRCDYFTLTIYFRIFIPEMFPEYSKGVYSDSDVIFLRDVAELYDTDIGQNYIGACPDTSVVNIREVAEYMENAVGVDRSKYINSGMLLMDLETLREKNIGAHFLDLYDKYHFDCIAPDQDYLNAICAGKIRYLDQAWNAMPNGETELPQNPGIVHFNLFKKPWLYDDVRYCDVFWEYAKESGFIDELRSRRMSYTENQKKSDNDCLALIISRGAEIPGHETTFRKMHESGAKIRL